MQNKLIIYLSLIFFLLCTYEVIPQTWEKNNVTEYFSDKFISDIATANNKIWLMDREHYLYSVENDSIQMYNIPRNIKYGRLEDYREDFKERKFGVFGEMFYIDLSSNDEVLWLIHSNRSFIKIGGGYFEKYDCELDSNLEVINHQVDKFGNLWILFKIYKNGNYIFYMDKDGKYSIEKIKFPYKVSSTKNFYVYKEKLHFIISIYNEKRDIYSDYDIIYSDNPELNDKINDYLPIDKYTEYKINFPNDSTFIIISSKGEIIYSDIYKERPAENTSINISSSCYWFTVINNLIYLSNEVGFYKYDITSRRLLEVIDVGKEINNFSFLSPYFYQFKYLTYFDNHIWGLNNWWGEFGKSVCDVSTNGIKIYKIK